MNEALKAKIRDIPDFPQKGILFKDITPLLNDATAFRQAVESLGTHYQSTPIDVVVSIEARGFILGAALAYYLQAGLVPIRKAGKLPYRTHKATYELEYGTDVMEMHLDALQPGQHVLLVDDVLATGGTMLAATDLVKQAQANIIGIAVLIELSFLKGRERLKGYDVFSLLRY
ncbi:MAG: adenine phosphoribosyltransferase [Nitrospinota bacterium]|nr:MAG: adenine phosphoribosyltransferase [Nitrospinota bacterium]